MHLPDSRATGIKDKIVDPMISWDIYGRPFDPAYRHNGTRSQTHVFRVDVTSHGHSSAASAVFECIYSPSFTGFTVDYPPRLGVQGSHPWEAPAPKTPHLRGPTEATSTYAILSSSYCRRNSGVPCGGDTGILIGRHSSLPVTPVKDEESEEISGSREAQRASRWCITDTEIKFNGIFICSATTRQRTTTKQT